ncbi:hypothetical protein LB505_003338 [Fusarium chuoi]|nr:hypothetical protein LB505_003338 [Fusarium chuoi]
MKRLCMIRHLNTCLYAESEDSAPVSRPGRRAQRRNLPKHAFWLTFVALVAAAPLGVGATTIGEVQVWNRGVSGNVKQ